MKESLQIWLNLLKCAMTEREIVAAYLRNCVDMPEILLARQFSETDDAVESAMHLLDKGVIGDREECRISLSDIQEHRKRIIGGRMTAPESAIWYSREMVEKALAMIAAAANVPWEDRSVALRPFSEGFLDADVRASLSSIASLPVFEGVAPETLMTTLANSRINHCAKGDVLAVQGERASWFNIVMEGWIKVFRTGDDGNESVLQIAGRGESLTGGGGPYETSNDTGAQAVTRAVVLSISLPAMKQAAVKDARLALNLLADASRRTTDFIGRFEQTTRHSSRQRLGWLLLKLRMDAGGDTLKIKLPFDKFLIAAILDMEPETLSRALKEFRKDGFSVGRTEVWMPHARALCEYCDAGLFNRCPHADADDCPHALSAGKRKAIN